MRALVSNITLSYHVFVLEDMKLVDNPKNMCNTNYVYFFPGNSLLQIS
jgi:hypothetical protein